MYNPRFGQSYINNTAVTHIYNALHHQSMGWPWHGLLTSTNEVNANAYTGSLRIVCAVIYELIQNAEPLVQTRLLWLWKREFRTWGVHYWPMLMAGGSVNWSISTKWYKGSGGRKPKLSAAFTTPIPIIGSSKYLTNKIPNIIVVFIFADRNPVQTKHLVSNLCISSSTTNYMISHLE